MKRVLAVLAFGLGGAAILLWLGLWQVQRLGWKEGVIAGIEARIAEVPQQIPAAPQAPGDEYLAVTAQGTLAGPVIRVLVGLKERGAGCRIVQVLEGAGHTVGRRLLVDRGFVPAENCKDPFRGGMLELTGNLHWPDEQDRFTPPPEPDWREGGFWFARDLPAMAAALGAEPVLIVARSDTGEGIRPIPIGVEGIANDHLQYAVTWFGLALVWLGMTALLLRRISRRTA